MTPQSEEINLLKYFKVMGRRKWLILSLMVVAVLTAYLVSLSQPQTYQTTARVKLSNPSALIYPTPAALKPSELNPGALYLVALNPAHLQPEAINALVTSDKLLKKVIEKLNLDMSIDALRGALFSSQMEGANILFVSATHTRPELAKAIADTVAHYLVQERQKSDQERKRILQEKLKEISQQIEEIKNQSNTLENLLAQTASDPTLSQPERAQIMADDMQALSSLRSPRFSLAQDYYNLRMQLSEMGKTEISALASLPESPRERPVTFNLIFAGILALVAGIALALGLEYWFGTGLETV